MMTSPDRVADKRCRLDDISRITGVFKPERYKDCPTELESGCF